MTDRIGKIKWGNVVLFFSLALNFFIAGYLVSDSGIFQPMHEGKIIHKRPEIRIVDYFPQQERQKFHRMMRKHHKELMPIQRRIFESQKEFFKVIAEQQVDEEKLRQVFRKYQDASGQLQVVANDMIIKMMLDMDYNTRLAVIRRGEKAHQRREMLRKERLIKRQDHKERPGPPPEDERP